MVVLGVLLSVHANADENGVLIEGVYYNLVTASKTATVTNGSTAYTGAVTIPATVIWEDITYDVTSISMEAFKGCGGLTSVSIPGSVAKIGDQAFYNCTGLTSVTIPDGVTSIGNEAFRNCSNLATVVIGDDVKTIGYDAFYECKAMTALTLGKRVETIGDGAFYYCSKLSSITIPNSITNIGSNAFASCNSLWSVNITNLQAWCKISFENDRANPLEGPRTQSQSAARLYLKELVIPNNVTSIKPYAFTECQGLRAVTIPNSVTSIETSAFYSCDNLTTVNIEGNGTTIGNYVFYNCGNLTTLNITGNLTSIGANAFEGCYGLKKVDITDLSAWCKTAFSTLGAPLEYAHHLYLNGVEITDLQIPNGTTTISAFAFSGCTALQSVSIPSSVKSIGYRAFYGCTGLASVKIPDSVTSLGNEAFSGCSNLTSATLGNGIPSIGYGTFNGCSSLSTVEFGTGITSIGEMAFNNCAGLTDVTLGSNVQSIVKQAFHGCKNMATVTIPGSVTSIEDYAFHECYGLKTVNITSLEEWCNINFHGGWNGSFASPMEYATTLTLNGQPITDLVIPEGISSIGNYAFKNLKCLKSVLISNDVTSIGNGAFLNCNNLSSATIGSSVTSVGDEAFYGCTSLQNLTIGNSVNSIGLRTFYNCGDLRSIVVVKGNSKYDSRENCNAIIVTNTNTLILGCRNTVIPETVTTIDEGSFYGCTGLTYISIPNSVTSFDTENSRWHTADKIFYGCNSLKEVEFHNRNIPRGGTGVFGDYYTAITPNIEKIILGKEVETIDGGAFQSCTNMQTVISYIQEPFAFGNDAFNFNNVYNTCKLIVPAGTRDAYIAKGWTESVFKGGVVEADPNSFVVADQTVNRGATVTIPIELNNVTPVTAFQFEVNLPEGITWSRCTLTDRKDDHIISAKKQATGNYMVTAISLSDESFSGTSGAIAKLELKVDGQQIAGLYRLNIKNIGLTAEDGSELHPLDVSNTLAINDFTLGDTNGDGNVTITDAVMVVSHVLGNDPEGFVSNAADMNDSGDITITDAVAIIKIVLDGQKTHAAERRTGVMVLDPQ